MTEEEKVEEESHREVFNPKSKTMDFRKVRATDVKSNPRVMLPRARTPKEEAGLLSRQSRAEDITSEYIVTQADMKNMTPSEYRGYDKIKKRVKKKEVVVYQTDKSGLMAIASLESYKRQGEKHVPDDTEVSWQEVTESQKQLRGHVFALNKIFSIGEDQRERQNRSRKQSN